MALTIVTTVGLGLGLVAVVFTILNAFVFRIDEVRRPHELFAVERQRSANAEPEEVDALQDDVIVRDRGIFSEAFASTGYQRHGSTAPRGKVSSSPGTSSKSLA